ncbi:hypothetical protein [Yinghuangia sp. YIM S10712]|uniref:hypothetical protein n=1 Tax=Yinghuangia sp. YIM S10712 TaxID=3436930 RepID=UPI003F53763C
MPAGRPLRLLRATLFAAVCVLLALVGHAFMSDTPVPEWAAFAAFAALTAVAWAAAARERGLVAISAGVLTTQAALHTLFALTRPGASGHGLTREQIEAQWLRLLLCNEDGIPADAGPQWSAASLLDRMGLDPALARQPPPVRHAHEMPDGEVMSAMAAHPGHGSEAVLLHGGVGMLVMHAFAAFGCALWLRRGEKALFYLLRLLAARTSFVLALVRLWTGGYGVPPAARHARAPHRRPKATPRWAFRPLSRRGPPAHVAI